MLKSDLRSELRWMSSGFLLTFFSGYGQTYFIALFAGYIKTDLSISDSQFGSIYAIGTLCSAALLVWAGKFADRLSVRWLGTGVMTGLVLTSLLMASVKSAWMLTIVVFGLRFFGQGMLTHLAMTAISRWFSRNRGRAVSIAALGLPVGSAVLPLIAVTLATAVGWRLTWVAAAVGLVVLPMPMLLILLKQERPPMVDAMASANLGSVLESRVWTRSDVLKSSLFYALMPGILAQPFVHTGIFFSQVAIVQAKAWDLSWFAASYPVFAVVSVLSGLVAGRITDRAGARRLLPVFLIPLGISGLILVYASSPYALTIFMAAVGLTAGSSSVIQGALWAELYGTEHLGTIRALVLAGVVFASALSPGVMGILLDAGATMEMLLLAMALYCFAAALWMTLLIPRLDRLATAGKRAAH